MSRVHRSSLRYEFALDIDSNVPASERMNADERYRYGHLRPSEPVAGTVAAVYRLNQNGDLEIKRPDAPWPSDKS